MKHFLVFFSVLLFTVSLHAQLSDLARVEYVGIPIKDEDVSFDRYRAMFNLPIDLKKGRYFAVGLDYSKIDVRIDQDLVPFSPEPLSEFQTLEFSMGYTYKMNKDWRFAATVAPGFSSNLSSGKVTIDDATLAVGVFFIRDRKETAEKPERLVLGISAANNRGFPILPFISYYKKFHEKWSFNLGVPKTNLQYHLSEKHRFKTVLRLDGFNGFLQEGIAIDDQVADRFRARVLLGGLRYEYKFTKNLELYFNGSYILDSNLVLRRSATENVFEITEKGNFYVKTGVRFKI